MKKIISSILCLTLMLSLYISSSAGVRKGDTDGDGVISVTDARAVLRIAIKLDESKNKAVEDVDSDGNITVTDARLILRAAIGLEALPQAPAEDTLSGNKPLSTTEIYNRAESYTVEINVETAGYTATGSGFFISPDGLIATNNHVIENAINIKVTDINGNEYVCDRVIGYDPDIDIAIIGVEANDHACAELSDNYSTGDTVYTLGSALGLSYTFSNGVIANAKREIPDYNKGMYYIQISAPISSGNSGGPLINEEAKVVGINTLSIEEGQNLNFSVPVSKLSLIDKNGGMTAGEFYEMNKTGVYASALKLKELCVEYGAYGSSDGINYCTLSTLRGACSLTYYYDYDILSVSSSTKTGNLIKGETDYYDEIIIGSTSKFEAYSMVEKYSGGLLGGSYTTLVDASYKLDGGTFTKGSPVSYGDDIEKDDSVTDVSEFEAHSGQAVENMILFLQTVISAYKLDITVSRLGFENF